MDVSIPTSKLKKFVFCIFDGLIHFVFNLTKALYCLGRCVKLNVRRLESMLMLSKSCIEHSILNPKIPILDYCYFQHVPLSYPKTCPINHDTIPIVVKGGILGTWHWACRSVLS